MKGQYRSAASKLRIVLFGSDGGFSAPLLSRMLSRGLCIGAVVMLETRQGDNRFPAMVQQSAGINSLEEIARLHRIQIIKTQNLNDVAFVEALDKARADVFIIGCFAGKIPARIHQGMRQACWNLHPSLLPAYRGPAPLYWQIKHHEINTGISLHEVSPDIDGGDIVAQYRGALPAQHDKKSLDLWVSEQGVVLLYDALTLYVEGELESVAQNEAFASYFPYPRGDGCTA